MVRFTILAVLSLAPCGAAAPGSPAQDGLADAVFSTVPFDQWLDGKQQAPLHWSLRLSHPDLSTHQRLSVTLEAQVDGAELARRRGEGKFQVLVQLIDGNNRKWQNHQELDLEQMQEGIKGNNAVFSESFFALPGNYQVAVAVFDTASREHNLIRRKLHVSPLPNDPLPDMWRGLPAVEFFVPDSDPDRWLLPRIEGRLKLPVETRHPLEVTLLVNLTPPERFAASSRIQNRNLEALLPSAKVLSQVEWHDARFSLELLDLARRRVAFRQDNIRSPDWPAARAALNEVNPGVIDVRSLENRRFNADFFLNRVARKIQGQPVAVRPSRVLIILSASVFFEPGVEMKPIGIAARPDVKVIYIRYQPRAPIRIPTNPEGPMPRPYGPVVEDQLEPLLKPLAPQLFSVSTPQEFRRSLAVILAEIAKL